MAAHLISFSQRTRHLISTGCRRQATNRVAHCDSDKEPSVSEFVRNVLNVAYALNSRKQWAQKAERELVGGAKKRAQRTTVGAARSSAAD